MWVCMVVALSVSPPWWSGNPRNSAQEKWCWLTEAFFAPILSRNLKASTVSDLSITLNLKCEVTFKKGVKIQRESTTWASGSQNRSLNFPHVSITVSANMWLGRKTSHDLGALPSRNFFSSWFSARVCHYLKCAGSKLSFPSSLSVGADWVLLVTVSGFPLQTTATFSPSVLLHQTELRKLIMP